MLQKFKSNQHIIDAVSQLNKQITNLLKDNIGKSFVSPRDKVFKTNTREFKISSVHADRVYVKFDERKYEALPLVNEMFNRVLEYLQANSNKAIPLGARLTPPYNPVTIEGVIWKDPYPIGTVSYKASPHVCDILCLAGLVEYTHAINPISGRQVQAVKLK